MPVELVIGQEPRYAFVFFGRSERGRSLAQPFRRVRRASSAHALARAFFRAAPLVVLDEPTAALDPRAEHELYEGMHDLFTGRTVLLFSHRLPSIRSADRIYVLESSQVAERGTHDQLMELGGRYAEMYTLQADTRLAPP